MFRILLAFVMVAALASQAFAQRGQCNVGQNNNQVNTAAVLQSLAQQQAAVAQPRAIVTAPARVSTSTAIVSSPSILTVPPPVTVLAAAPVATVTAQAATVQARRRPFFLPPKQVAVTRDDGTSIAVNRQ